MLLLARDLESAWIRVEVLPTGETGWVSAGAQYVDCNRPILDLPLGRIPPAPTFTPTLTPTPSNTPTSTPTVTVTPTVTPTPDTVAGYYHGAGFGGVAVSHLQDNVYYLESDPGTWGWTGCGMPWEDRLFAVGKTTNPDASGLAYTLVLQPVGDRKLLKMVYFTDKDGSLLANEKLEGIRIDSHEFEDTVPGDSLPGRYSGGISISHIRSNVYSLESNAGPWGWKGCGIASGNKIFGIARSTHPEGRGLTYTLHIDLDDMKLKVKLIYFIDYDGNLVYLPSTIRVDPHELTR